MFAQPCDPSGGYVKNRDVESTELLRCDIKGPRPGSQV